MLTVRQTARNRQAPFLYAPILVARLNICNYNKSMMIEFDPAKRDKNLTERGLDFARAAEVFAGLHFTGEDAREDYEESRFITVGTLDGRMIVMVWTPRGEARRIISMRKANDREKARYAQHLG